MIHNLNLNFSKQEQQYINVIYLDKMNTNEECSICLNILNRSILKTECNHFFHKECLTKWKNKTCPLCRKFII